MGIRRTHILVGLSLTVVMTALVVVGAGWATHGANAQSTPTLALDMDPTNGNGPCDPVDSVRPVTSGDTFQVAVCLTNATTAPIDFQFDLNYNDDLNQCVPSDCSGTTCLDGNPDANVGSTAFGGGTLGTGWDCNIMQVQGPVCDRDPGSGKGHGDAFLQCNSVAGDLTLNTGDGVSAPIAMVTFKSTASGTDTMTFGGVVEVDDNQIGTMIDSTKGAGSIVGGSVSTEGVPPTLTPGPTSTIAPSATPMSLQATATAVYIATAIAQGTPAAVFTPATATSAPAKNTPAAGATSGAKTTPTAKATSKPGTATATSGGSSGPNAGMIAGIVVACVVVVGAAGWFGYRRFFRAR